MSGGVDRQTPPPPPPPRDAVGTHPTCYRPLSEGYVFIGICLFTGGSAYWEGGHLPTVGGLPTGGGGGGSAL